MTDAEEFLFSLYTVEKELSCTNISQVALVRHQLDGQLYIRRILPKNRCFLYQTLKQLSLFGVPVIKEVIYDGRTIVFEEYIHGTSLAKLAQNKLSADDFTTYMTALLKLLHTLHANDIIHRDLKEENILIDKNKQLYLIDFAIANSIHAQEENLEDILGTITYAAPEQFGLSSVDARSDLYSFGKICLNLLPCCPTLPSVQKEMWTKIANTCLSFSPQERYASAQEILKMIEQPALFHGSEKEHILLFLHTEFPPSVQIQNKEIKTVTDFFHMDSITFSEQNGEVCVLLTTKHSSDKFTIFAPTKNLMQESQSLTEFFLLKDSILAVRMIYHPITLLSKEKQKIPEFYQVRQIYFPIASSVTLSTLYENLSGYSVLGTEEMLLDRETLNSYSLHFLG